MHTHTATTHSHTHEHTRTCECGFSFWAMLRQAQCVDCHGVQRLLRGSLRLCHTVRIHSQGRRGAISHVGVLPDVPCRCQNGGLFVAHPGERRGGVCMHGSMGRTFAFTRCNADRSSGGYFQSGRRPSVAFQMLTTSVCPDPHNTIAACNMQPPNPSRTSSYQCLQTNDGSKGRTTHPEQRPHRSHVDASTTLERRHAVTETHTHRYDHHGQR